MPSHSPLLRFPCRRVPSPRGLGRPAPQAVGFTLIELLIVIGIISLLISIVTPSFGRARDQAKSTVCLTRLSEFAKGLTSYANDHDWRLPPLSIEISADATRDGAPPAGDTADEAGDGASSGDLDASGPIRHGWAEALWTYLYRNDNFTRTRSYPIQRNLSGDRKLFVCQAGEPAEASTGHYRPYQRQYRKGSLESMLPLVPFIMDANPQVTLPEDAETNYIVAERLAGLAGEAFIDERHYGGANYIFPDGHADRSTSLKAKLAADWDLDSRTENY